MAAPFEARMRDFGRRLRSRVRQLSGDREEAAVIWAWSIHGWSTKNELRLLYRSAREAGGPGDIAEIGSWKGRTAIILARALRDAGAAARVWAIDHHMGSGEERHARVLVAEGSTEAAFRANVGAAGIADRVEPLVMSSGEAAAELARRRRRLRMIFIDGAHEEESVRHDIRAFLPLLRPGGLVALHDCEDEDAGFPGVWQAYRAELQSRSEVVGRVDSLLIARVGEAPVV